MQFWVIFTLPIEFSSWSFSPFHLFFIAVTLGFNYIMLICGVACSVVHSIYILNSLSYAHGHDDIYYFYIRYKLFIILIQMRLNVKVECGRVVIWVEMCVAGAYF